MKLTLCGLALGLAALCGCAITPASQQNGKAEQLPDITQIRPLATLDATQPSTAPRNLIVPQGTPVSERRARQEATAGMGKVAGGAREELRIQAPGPDSGLPPLPPPVSTPVEPTKPVLESPALRNAPPPQTGTVVKEIPGGEAK